MKKELVIFETLDKEISLSVEILENTVWLTQNQMAELFKTTKQNISLHANNCFKEGELDKKSVVKESLTTAADGKNYKTSKRNDIKGADLWIRKYTQMNRNYQLCMKGIKLEMLQTRLEDFYFKILLQLCVSFKKM